MDFFPRFLQVYKDFIKEDRGRFSCILAILGTGALINCHLLPWVAVGNSSDCLIAGEAKRGRPKMQPPPNSHGWLSKLWSLFGYPKY